MRIDDSPPGTEWGDIQKDHSVVQRVPLYLSKFYAVDAGQNNGEPPSSACLLAVLLINMHLTGQSNSGQHA